MSLTRRQILLAGSGAALTGCGGGKEVMNLVPPTPCSTPSYWTTWGAQRFASGPQAWRSSAAGERSAAVSALSEARVFGKDGWGEALGHVRSDFILLLDWGWNTPAGAPVDGEPWRLSSLGIDTAKFPSARAGGVSGMTRLVEMSKAAGWKGLGFAVRAPQDGEGGRLEEAVEALRPALRLAHQAEVSYWRLEDISVEGRHRIASAAQGEASRLFVENAPFAGPLNDAPIPGTKLATGGSGYFRLWGHGKALEEWLELLKSSRVVGSGKTTVQLSIPTTLDRVGELFEKGSRNLGMDGLINCGEEAYIAAVLGCTMGIARHPAWEDPEGLGLDPRTLRRRWREVVRAIRWQRIAPPWPVGYSSTRLDGRLEDSWVFKAGDGAPPALAGVTVKQGAAARIGRNIPLPKLAAPGGDPPYVIASLHPNGATAVATLPRTNPSGGFSWPEADVSLYVEDALRPIGVFGRFRSLTLDLGAPPERMQVWAQDLAADEAREITKEVLIAGSTVVVQGELINRLSQSPTSSGDLSDPGLVLKILAV